MRGIIQIVGVIAVGLGWTIDAIGASEPRMLGGAQRPLSIQDIPSSKLRSQLDSISSKSKLRAIERLRTFEFPVEDTETLNADSRGDIFYTCEFPAEPTSDGSKTRDLPPQVLGSPISIAPFPSSLILHSRPGSTNVIFLDFDGHVVVGTAWNNSLSRTQIIARAFSTDSDATTYSDAEQDMIKRIWQRVKEDFAPFDVDVTTEEPPVVHTRVARVLITRNTDTANNNNPSSTAGGVAYVNFFGSSLYAYYSPAWVYHNNLSNSEGNIAEAASHEAGHNLGLSHDGKTGGISYYTGHGSNVTSWAPIMGTGYGRSVTQWSKGEYYLANNTQDDLQILTGKLGYIPDDHGDTLENATQLALLSNSIVQATTPLNDPGNLQPENKGVISPNGDADVWAFASGNGNINLHIKPWISAGTTRGNNLDISVSLLNSNGNVIASSNPTNETMVDIQMTLTSGVYYLKVERSSFGTPTNTVPTGYTDYGSCGQYFITGSIPAAAEIIIDPDPPAALAFTLDPSEAVAQAAGWRIMNHSVTNWQSSGAKIEDIQAGDYMVTFKPLAGWNAPENVAVSLEPGETNELSTVYSPITTTNSSVPYWWLNQYGYTNNQEQAVQQIAANGMTVGESYIAGLNPNDPASVFMVDLINVEPGSDMILQWSAVSGRVYSIFHLDEPGGMPQPLPDAQNIAWPRSSYTNHAGAENSGILQIRVHLP